MTETLLLGTPMLSGDHLQWHDLQIFLHAECPHPLKEECLTFCDRQTTCITLVYSASPLQVSWHIYRSSRLSQRKLPGLQREITLCNFVNLGAYQFPEALNRGQFPPYVPKCTLFTASSSMIVSTVNQIFPWYY